MKVKDILRVSDIFQIGEPIVEANPILVIDLASLWTRSKKGEGDELMDGDLFWPFPRRTKLQRQIARGAFLGPDQPERLAKRTAFIDIIDGADDGTLSDAEGGGDIIVNHSFNTHAPRSFDIAKRHFGMKYYSSYLPSIAYFVLREFRDFLPSLNFHDWSLVYHV